MKKVEIFIISFFALLFLLSKYSERFVYVFVISALLISSCYFYLSVYLLNEFAIKDLFKSHAYQGLSGGLIVLQVLSGFAYSTAIVTLIFEIMHFPGTLVLKIIAALLIMTITLAGVLNTFQYRPKYTAKSSVILRACIFLVILLIP